MSREEQVTEKGSQIRIPKKTLTIEFYVGIFTVLGLACLAYLATNLAGMKFLERGFYEITAEFDNISGLEEGANVEIAGVPIGEVSSIRLDGTAALVKMKIRETVPLRPDDIAAVRTKGIIGERYVKIIPGGHDDRLPPGGSVTDTESVVEFEEIIGKFIHKLE